MNSPGQRVYGLAWLMRVAAALAVAVTAACGSVDGSGSAADPTLPAASERESSSSASAAALPEASLPEASVSEASVPEGTAPEASVPEVSVPEGTAPEVSVPVVSVPVVSVPEGTAPDVSVPEGTAPDTSVPSVSVPSVSLPVAAEYDSGYDRDDWGPHDSDLCRGAVGSPDPYTGTPIDTCNVDHVVALHEAHESGGWAWSGAQKQRFSRDPDNHVASRACVNQSKGADDISEWSDAGITSSSACGGGYSVTPAGRCFLARTTLAVKLAWDLSVDQSEAEALGRTLAGCGDQAPGFSVQPQAPATTTPTTTAVPLGECVIGGKTAAEYDAVSGIGEVLSARLADAQPFTSRADLEAVRGIGPARSEAVWSHFCAP